MAIVLRNGNTKHLPPSVEGGDFRRKSEGVFKENNEDHEVVEGEYRNKLNCVGTGVPDCPLQHKSYFCVGKVNSLRLAYVCPLASHSRLGYKA